MSLTISGELECNGCGMDLKSNDLMNELADRGWRIESSGARVDYYCAECGAAHELAIRCRRSVNPILPTENLEAALTESANRAVNSTAGNTGVTSFQFSDDE